ncbi:MAG: hypothetical protein AAF242_01760 [Bacteroidota bacterium]
MKFEAKKEKVICKEIQMKKLLSETTDLSNITFRAFDFSNKIINWQNYTIDNTVFLGCTFSLEQELLLRRMGAYIYDNPDIIPYDPFRTDLYTWQELMEGYTKEKDNSIDLKIYEHFSNCRYNPSINEALWQRIHDHAIDNALRELIQYDDEGMSKLKCVGFMGGHGMHRDDPHFINAALTAKLVAEEGYFITTGGGPGIMEAANLGAYFAGKTDQEFQDVLKTLATAPHYTSEGYHEQALEVLGKYPKGNDNLAIPTWFYGHEPSNLFASHIAKYFSNSIREDNLIAISLYGIVFAPGSAGTTQEIFMDATQNHYGTFNYHSPMVFLGRQRYEIETLIFPLLKQLAWGKPYFDQLHITDYPEEVRDFLLGHPPIKNGTK